MMMPAALALLLAAVPPPAPAESVRPVVLFLGLDSEPADKGDAAVFLDAAAVHARKVTRMQVATLADVKALLSVALVQQAAGCDGPSCVADIAAATHAEQVVSGRLGRVGKETQLTMSRIRARDGVVLARVTRQAGSDPLLMAAMPDVVKQLFTEHAPPPVTLRLRVLARRAGATTVEVLKGGEKLKQGDRVAFEFNVEPSCNVYLLQRTRASGALNVLFPAPEIAVRNPIPGARSVRIPDGEDWFEVDDRDIGMEHVFVVASPFEAVHLADAVAKLETPLGRQHAELALAALARDDTSACRGSLPGIDSVAAGDGCARRTRGLKLASASKAEQATTVTIKSAENDDTVMTVFSFEHVPAGQ